MIRRYRRNLTQTKSIVGEARFTGKKKDIACGLSISDLPKSVLLVGELIEFECETPLESKVDSYGLIKSKRRPLVVASGDGKYVMIVSGDKVVGAVELDESNNVVKEAVDLHEAFHGTEHDQIKAVDTLPAEKLFFFGHLNFIVYSVPEYSERRGVPFIHEAKDRGDDEPPAKEKPIVCVSPNRDFLIMYGAEFSFTERGIIG